MKSSQKKILILLLIVFLILTESLLVKEFLRTANEHLNMQQEKYENEINIITASYRTISQIYYDNLISDSKIAEIMDKAINADSDTQAELRGSLYEKEKNEYLKMKENGIRQFHFILSDGTSFLRFHQPDYFGDQLEDVRPTVKKVNETHIKTEGFEEGRIYGGYRFEYPVFHGDKYVGCVEISISFISAIEAVDTFFDTTSFVLIKKDVVDSVVWPSAILNNYIPNELTSDEYYLDREGVNYIFNTDKYDSLISDLLEIKNYKTTIASKMAEDKSFAINQKIAGEYYANIFLAVKDTEKKTIGYLVFLSKNPDNNLFIRNMHIKAILLLCLFVLILFILISYSKYKERIEKLTYYDKLTGVYNRNLFYNFLEQQIFDFKKNENPFSIIMFDIDNFKDINDSMGHLTGDLTLQHIAKLTLANIRNTDYLIRFGGDEFIIILPETRRDDAVEVAEKLRKLICNDEQLKQFKTDISISCGVTEYTRGETSEQLIEKTDKVLYKAKKTGRNKVSI